MTTIENPVRPEELLKEFEKTYRLCQSGDIPDDADGIIVLSAGKRPREENISRVRLGSAIFNTHKLVPFVFSGVSEEEQDALWLIKRWGIPRQWTYFQDCGPQSIANTKNQFEALISKPPTSTLKNLVIVTSLYHIPRALRTAGKLLPQDVNFVVIAEPPSPAVRDTCWSDDKKKIQSEIERIIEYSAKGDILARPR